MSTLTSDDALSKTTLPLLSFAHQLREYTIVLNNDKLICQFAPKLHIFQGRLQCRRPPNCRCQNRLILCRLISLGPVSTLMKVEVNQSTYTECQLIEQ